MTNGWQIARQAIEKPGLRIIDAEGRVYKFNGQCFLINFGDDQWRPCVPYFDTSTEWKICEERAKEPKTVVMWQPVFKKAPQLASILLRSKWTNKEDNESLIGYIKHEVELV